MPFYISSCLFTSYVLYVCLCGLHMCHVCDCVCTLLCMRIKSTPRTTQCIHCSFHFIFSIICANKFNHLATYKSTTIYFIECDYSLSFFAVILFHWTKHAHIQIYDYTYTPEQQSVMPAVGSFILSLVCWPNKCNTATIISLDMRAPHTRRTHTHGHMACAECFKYVFCSR